MQAHFLIITGMSGAGKSQVIRTLEDLDFFCIDNLPATLIPKFVELCRQTDEENVAMVVDIRGGKFFDQLIDVLNSMKENGQKYELLYLDADNDVLVRRFKETRRSHPLGNTNSLLTNIHTEREQLEILRRKATHIIDTSGLTVAQLKKRVMELFYEDQVDKHMGIVVRSFGFKHGLPVDSDLVLDVRFLPNPFYVPELRPLTGNDQPIIDYLNEFPQTAEYLRLELPLLEFLVPQYINEGKNQLVISVGCTGGQHRSVYIANRIYKFLLSLGYNAEITHRDARYWKN